MTQFILIFCSWIFAEQADHLLLTRVVTQPNAAESISIYNPTNSPIDLTNYYICDDEEYYKIQTEGDLSPSSSISGFTAQFPDHSIVPGDTFHIILNENYSDFYAEDFVPDIIMYGSDNNSMIETESGSIGFSNNKISESSELIILFKWDGNSETLILDVDYFLWSSLEGVTSVVDKTNIGDYAEDTPIDEQLYFNEEAMEYYAYSRIGIEEIDETNTGGNGITTHDETSENFRVSWEIISLFSEGCTDPLAENYLESAVVDDGSCILPDTEESISIYDIIHNCGADMDESLECDGEYNLSSASAVECPLYESQVTTTGIIIDYFDITPFNGPHSFTIEDENGYRIDFVVWPESSSYQDGFDITQHTSLNVLTQPPFGIYQVEITGELGAYCGGDEVLDINSEWQVTIEYESDITIISESNYDGYFSPGNYNSATINPAPFVIIPSLGETLDFTYSHPANCRVIIRVFDLSGRFISSLLDKYVEDAGIWYNGVSPDGLTDSPNSSWHGRNNLGQLVSPGTYIIHIEAMNPITGETYTDAAPIVVGVKN